MPYPLEDTRTGPAPWSAPPVAARLGAATRTIVRYYAVVGFTLLSAYYFFAAITTARRTAPWFDELFTIHVARSESVRIIIERLHAGMDTHPPLYYVLSHLCASWGGGGVLGYRFPSIVGLWLAMAALYTFFSSRRRPEAGLLCCALLLSTPALSHAVEARPYALLVGLGAWVLYLWGTSPVSAGRRPALVGLAACASLACWLHYYAIFLLIPLSLGEWSKWRRSGRFDAGACLALAVVALNAVPMYWFARPTALAFSPTFWARPGTPLELLKGYHELFGPMTVVLGLSLLAAVSWSRAAVPHRISSSGVLPAEHGVVAAAFALIPFATWIVAKVATNAFAPKYSLLAVVGVSAICATGAALLADANRVRLWIVNVGACLAAVMALHFVLLQSRAPTPGSVAAQNGLFEDLGAEQDAPLVFENALDYLPAFHYADEVMRERMAYLTDLASSKRLIRNDTLGRAMDGLQRFTNVRAIDYDRFTAEHRRFVVISRHAPEGSFWLTRRLLEADPQQFKLVAQRAGITAHLVELGP